MNQVIIIIYSLIALSLIACGSKPDRYVSPMQKQARAENPHLKINISDASNTNDFADRFDIKCEDKNDCPDFVGSLLSFTKKAKGNSIGLCSFTLISQNRILTNDHCLSQKNITTNDCSNIYAVFPENKNYEYAKVKCKKIIANSQYNQYENYSRPDWAILELEENVQRTPIKLNVNGLNNNSLIQLYPTFYDKVTNSKRFGHQGVIKKISCQSKMASKLMMIYNQPQSPLIALDCMEELIKGNSGSGIIKDNELVGVFSAIAESGDEVYMGNKTTLTGKAAGGTNLHCISPLNDNHSPESCHFDINKDHQQDYLYSLAYSLYVDANTLAKYKNILNSDPSIKWDRYDDNFLNHYNIIINKNVFREQIVNEDVKEHFYKNKFPNYPACVSKNRIADIDFTLVLPFYSYDIVNSIVTSAAIYKTPMKLRSLGYKVNYDQNTQSFIAELIRMSDIQELNKFINLKNISINLYKSCEQAKSPEDCVPFVDAGDDLDNFLINSNYEPYFFHNEDLIGYNRINPSLTVQIPVCN